MDYGPICGLVLRRTTLPPPKLELQHSKSINTTKCTQITPWLRSQRHHLQPQEEGSQLAAEMGFLQCFDTVGLVQYGEALCKLVG